MPNAQSTVQKSGSSAKILDLEAPLTDASMQKVSSDSRLPHPPVFDYWHHMDQTESLRIAGTPAKRVGMNRSRQTPRSSAKRSGLRRGKPNTVRTGLGSGRYVKTPLMRRRSAAVSSDNTFDSPTVIGVSRPRSGKKTRKSTPRRSNLPTPKPFVIQLERVDTPSRGSPTSVTSTSSASSVQIVDPQPSIPQGVILRPKTRSPPQSGSQKRRSARFSDSPDSVFPDSTRDLPAVSPPPSKFVARDESHARVAFDSLDFLDDEFANSDAMKALMLAQATPEGHELVPRGRPSIAMIRQTQSGNVKDKVRSFNRLSAGGSPTSFENQKPPIPEKPEHLKNLPSRRHTGILDPAFKKPPLGRKTSAPPNQPGLNTTHDLSEAVAQLNFSNASSIGTEDAPPLMSPTIKSLRSHRSPGMPMRLSPIRQNRPTPSRSHRRLSRTSTSTIGHRKPPLPKFMPPQPRPVTTYRRPSMSGTRSPGRFRPLPGYFSGLGGHAWKNRVQ